ncbi:hypothetical protein ACP70R_028690 [Stipagrostis hirtigluma subsp. patula]
MSFTSGVMRWRRGDELIPVHQADIRPRRPRPIPGLPVIGGFLVLVFLTVNTAMTIYRSLGDSGAIASAASAYLNLVSLFFCVKLLMQAPPDPARSRLKAAVWLLTMPLTFQYVYEVMGAATPTLNGALLLWAMPAATGIAVFLQQERCRPHDEEMFPSGDEEQRM